MDSHDSRFTPSIARSSRRTALRAGAGGLAAALGAAEISRTAAQEATPTGEAEQYLFIQSFATGTLTSKEGASDRYDLVLQGGTGHTIYFADRPNRDFGAVPTGEMVATIGFDPADPPNAGIVAETDDGAWIIIVELSNPTLDDATGTLTYAVRRVTDYAGEGLQSLATKASEGAVPEQFGPVSLFIDSSATPPYCY